MIVTLLLLLSISFSAEWNRLSDLNSVNPVFSLESISSEETTIKLEFRVGINSGDVIKEKDNLLGDGVNIAARLEALAQANGITISK